MTIRSTHTLGGLALAAWALTSGTASGQESTQGAQLHGFGGWHYSRTSDPNLYLGGTPDGEFHNGRLALNAFSELSSRLTVSAQIEAVSGHETELELDYAFAGWKLSDALVLKTGYVKLPFGISTEVYDVGTARPFLDLAQSVYGPLGSVAERYGGVGLSGQGRSSGGWGVGYDVYFGGLSLEEYEAPEDAIRETLGEEEDGEGHSGEDGGMEGISLRNAAGARLVIETPVSGLSVGASVYHGEEETGETRTTWGAQAEYLSGPWSLRAEYVGGSHGEESRDAFYVEAARRLGAWQLAGRYDWFDSTLEGTAEGGSLLRHESWSVGLNYWFSPAFVLKASYHRVDGNRLAGPPVDQLAGLYEAGLLDPKTSAFQFGAQFSF